MEQTPSQSQTPVTPLAQVPQAPQASQEPGIGGQPLDSSPPVGDSPQQSNEPEEKNNKMLFIILGIVGLLIVGGILAAFFFMSKTPMQEQTVQTTAVPTQVPSPSPAATEAADLQSVEQVDVGTIESDLSEIEKELQNL